MLKRRTRSYPSRQLRADFRAYLQRNRVRLAGVLAVYVTIGAAMTAILVLLQPHGAVLWYVLGALHAAWIALAVIMIGLAWLAASQRAVYLVRGAFGEDNTLDVLKSARRRTIWGYVAGVEIGGGDIDHLVVTRRGGVLAIDSKWRNEVTPEVVESMAASARAAARRAESIMRSEHVGTLKRERSARHRAASGSYAVRPVVVVWGAEGHRMPAAATRSDVDFVAGPQLAPWLRSLDGHVVDKDAASDLLARLEAFKDR